MESTSRRPAYARLLDHAACILTVRDHSEQELRRKLTAPITGKDGPGEIDATAEGYRRTITQCHEHGYLDDSRFVVRFIVSRSRRGYGSTRTRQELNQKGISREAAEEAMRGCGIDWYALARDQTTRKYDEPLSTVSSEKVKIWRFLLYHGYLMEDIYSI